MKKIFIQIRELLKLFIGFISKGLKSLWKYRLALVSVLHAFVLLILTYFWLNLPFDYDAGEEHLTLFSFTKERFKSEHKYHEDFDSIVFINISYDKVLVPINDEIGMPAGMLPVTDRVKLDSLLRILNQNNYQKLVFMDIDFDEEYPEDSILAASMSKTRNLFVPITSNSYINNIPVTMGAVSGRKTLVGGDFFKYPYLFEGEKSIPVKFFEFLDEGSFVKNRMFYYRNGKLAFNSIVPNYYIPRFPKYNTESDYNYFDLGTDFFSFGQAWIENKVKNKIVVVGAFTEYDQHATFIGNMPGILILLNTYYNLKFGNNQISFWLILIFFFTYYFLTIHILEDRTLINISKLHDFLAKNRVLGFFVELVSFSIIFLVLSILIRILFNVYLNIVLVGIYFVLFNSFSQGIRKITKKKNKAFISASSH